MCLTFLNPTVFVYSSLSHSLALSHSLSCLPLWLYFYLCVCVCSEWKRSLQSSSPFPLHSRIISPPLRQGQQEVGVYIGLLYPQKKAAWVEELQSSSAVSASAAAALCHNQRNVPSPISCPTHGCFLAKFSESIHCSHML